MSCALGEATESSFSNLSVISPKSQLILQPVRCLFRFSGLLRSVSDAKEREWSSLLKLPHLFNPSKTATLVPEFAVEHLPLGRTPAFVPPIKLQLNVCSNGKPLHYYVLRVPRKVDRWR